MKAGTLLDTVHKDGEEHTDATVMAANRLRELHSDYVPQVERVLAGVCLIKNYKDWSMSIGTSSFAAPWKKAKVHSAIELYLTIPQVATWAELTPLFEALDAHAGIDAAKWSNSDDAASYSRKYQASIYEMDTPEEWGRVSLQITASLPGDTDTCKRVIVGYTMEQPAEPIPAQPIYELRCEE